MPHRLSHGVRIHADTDAVVHPRKQLLAMLGELPCSVVGSELHRTRRVDAGIQSGWSANPVVAGSNTSTGNRIAPRVGSDHDRGLLVATHQYVGELVAGVGWQAA